MTPVRRRARAVPTALLALCALATEAAAGPGRVLVLPLDGDADPAVRTRYSASVQRLARQLGGNMTAGDATFTDTATAIGCDPKAPACAEDVRATLGVDELVYGTVTRQNGQIVLVVWRTAKGKPRREASATLQGSDAPERIEPAIQPLFRDGKPAPVEGPPKEGAPKGGLSKEGPPKEGPPKEAPPKEAPPKEGPPKEGPPKEGSPKEGPPPSTEVRRDRTLGIAAAAGGGTLLLISIALWSSASDLEREISASPTATYNDFQRLRDLEDTATTRAWTGNVMFVAGLALGGLGGWLLYRDHKAHRTIVAPAPIANGAGLTLTWLGGLP
ncbi:MAG TPA: hypothetical protein VN253_21665 [Kofleriaceae bacterium]|nr:hypothetical protein [Kofleriaceae bacterium]